jgi:oligosaccharide 4-alpha-D-glucosyltransferase
LQAQVPIMLSMGQVGVGYMHSDAGGFGANATQDPELYTRWLQMAALSPILRPHSDQVVAPEPYTYPEPYKSIVRNYTHLRAELLPYLYTLAAENTLTGAPLVRAMDYYDYGAHSFRTIPIQSLYQLSDSAVITDGYYQWGQLPRFRSKNIVVPRTDTEKFGASPPNDQYLLGSELLVAPVSQPGQRRRNVMLPKSLGGWLDFETGQTLPDSQVVGLPAPLGHIPLLVRAGAVVPITTYRSSTAAFRPDTLALRYFPALWAGNRHFTVYEDDGHAAQALRQQQFVAFLLRTGDSSWDGDSDISSLTISKRGAYQTQPTSRLVRLEIMRVAVAPTDVFIGEQPLPKSAWKLDTVRHVLLVSTPLQLITTISFPGLRLLTQPVANLDPETLTLTAPDSRTFTDEVAIHYTRYTVVGQPETLRIRDQRGRVLRELPTLAGSGSQTLRWDGRDAQGHAVPVGVYVAEVAGQHQVLRRLP